MKQKRLEMMLALKRVETYAYVRMSYHAKQRLLERGYTNGDIAAIIAQPSSVIVEHSRGWNSKMQQIRPTYTLEGRDTDDNPLIVVVSEEGVLQYSIVTIMPPMDKRRFHDCI